jgi:hypothetical protein
MQQFEQKMVQIEGRPFEGIDKTIFNIDLMRARWNW